MDNKKRSTIVVNIFGGPGAGKTTAAWEIAEKLRKYNSPHTGKPRNFVVEYVPEYAKELTWDKNCEYITPLQRRHAEELLDGNPYHQREIFNEQLKRVMRLYGQCDFIITDSPVLLTMLYMIDSQDGQDVCHSQYVRLCEDCLDAHNAYPSFNMRVNRGSYYEQAGRNETMAQAHQKDIELTELLSKYVPNCGSYSREHIDTAINNMVRLHDAKMFSEEVKEMPIEVDAYDCTIKWNDTDEIEQVTFAIGDTSELDIDEMIFMSFDSTDEFYACLDGDKPAPDNFEILKMVDACTLKAHKITSPLETMLNETKAAENKDITQQITPKKSKDISND